LVSPDAYLNDNVITAVHHYVGNGMIPETITCLKQGASLNVRTKAEEDPERPGASPLHLAAYNGHNKMIEMLLVKFKIKGLNLMEKDLNNWTALHYAARKGHKTTCELLVELGAPLLMLSDQ
jgi:hypothetical protein